ncbi:hypothetical protein NGRA_1990, partial [Nosema granulosis]
SILWIDRVWNNISLETIVNCFEKKISHCKSSTEENTQETSTQETNTQPLVILDDQEIEIPAYQTLAIIEDEPNIDYLIKEHFEDEELNDKEESVEYEEPNNNPITSY